MYTICNHLCPQAVEAQARAWRGSQMTASQLNVPHHAGSTATSCSSTTPRSPAVQSTQTTALRQAKSGRNATMVWSASRTSCSAPQNAGLRHQISTKRNGDRKPFGAWLESSDAQEEICRLCPSRWRKSLFALEHRSAVRGSDSSQSRSGTA